MASADSNEKELLACQHVYLCEKCGEKKEREVLSLEDVIKKVKGITKSGSKVFKYAFEEQLDVVDVTWKDSAREKASIWG